MAIDYSALALPRKQTPCQQLFDDVSEFYFWYVSSWYMSDGPSEQCDATRKTLSLIKRIAEVSLKEGQFLSELEAQTALEELDCISQDLHSGKLRRQDLPEALLQIMIDITEHNAKAKVVFQTTELEYRLCINPPSHQSAEVTSLYQKVLTQIIQALPHVGEINAYAISQGLSQILGKSTSSHTEDLIEAVKRWL